MIESDTKAVSEAQVRNLGREFIVYKEPEQKVLVVKSVDDDTTGAHRTYRLASLNQAGQNGCH